MVESCWDHTPDALLRRGWASVSQQSAAQAAMIVRSLGTPVLDPRTGAEYSELLPYRKDSAPRGSMSSLIGTGEQPMHTDAAYVPLPPRYVVLHCLERGESYCPTNIWTTDDLGLRDEKRPLLTTPVWLFGNGVGPAFYSPVIEMIGPFLRVRFDPCCMRPASFSRHTIADARRALCDYAQQIAIEWQTGDLLVIDNWRCLHARGVGCDRSPSRRLRRWCIGVQNGMG